MLNGGHVEHCLVGFAGRVLPVVLDPSLVKSPVRNVGASRHTEGRDEEEDLLCKMRVTKQHAASRAKDLLRKRKTGHLTLSIQNIGDLSHMAETWSESGLCQQ